MEQFLTWEFAPRWRELETQLFLWSGFAIWIGIVARVPLRSRALRSPWLTLVLGFIGICLGPFLTRSFFQLKYFDPLGPAGIISSVIVATLAIAFFHVFSFLSPRNEIDDEEYDEYEDRATRENYDDREDQYYVRKNENPNRYQPYDNGSRSPRERNDRSTRRYPPTKRRQNY